VPEQKIVISTIQGAELPGDRLSNGVQSAQHSGKQATEPGARTHSAVSDEKIAKVNKRMPDDASTKACREIRDTLVRHGLGLEYLTVGWNVVEGSVSVIAALSAGSIALLGFGVDSFVETLSGAILIWRLRAERGSRNAQEVEGLDRRAHKLVAFSLFALAVYITFEASKALIARERPEPAVVGLVVTPVSMLVMWYLARSKRRAAAALQSRAMEADSFQTTACFWLSAITLIGIALNTAFGWWWADPVAALGMTYFLVAEGREAWRGEDGCSCS
jgi:divalent metal cation (Fe/Co/Zn/Cd) transporter